MSKAIMAVDPGETCGVAVWLESKPTEILTHQMESTELELACTSEVAIPMLATRYELELVVESFNIRGPRGKEAVATIEQIGQLRFIAHLYGVPVVLQDPSCKLFAGLSNEDNKLIHLGWYKEGERHANDAARHALYRAFSESDHETRDLIRAAWPEQS